MRVGPGALTVAHCGEHPGHGAGEMKLATMLMPTVAMTNVRPPSRMANVVLIFCTVWIGSVISSWYTGSVADAVTSVTFRRLSPVPTPGVEFFESVYPPNSMSNAHGDLLRHEGYEVGTVTAGELTVDFDTDVVTLAAGDSITYPCSSPHLIANRSAGVTAVATWLIVNS